MISHPEATILRVEVIENPTAQPSSSVGDYLKAVWEAVGSGAATTKEVADRLSVAPSSVTGMFARMQEMGLISYERYRGATLTDTGRHEALRLVRRHRLVEAFLVEHLGYAWEEVHREAESLEHAVSDKFTERLAAFLGHPDRDPHGDPIPTADGTVEEDASFFLSEAAVGQKVSILRVANEAPELLAYLGEQGLVPGRTLAVKEARTLDGVVTVEDEDGRAYSLGSPVAVSLFVKKSSEDYGR